MNISIRFELKSDRVKASGESDLLLRITCDRKMARIKVGFALKPNYWNKDKQEVRKSHPNYKLLNEHLFRLRAKAQEAYFELSALNKLSAKNIINTFKTDADQDFFIYADHFVKNLFNNGQIREAKNAQVVVNKIKKMIRKKSLLLKTIDRAFLDAFSIFLKRKCKNHNNTIRKNLLYLGRILNTAVNDGHLNINPLKDYPLPQNQATNKVALSIEQIEKIIALDLPVGSLIWHTRNYFMFSFYNAGIRFGDLCKLKKGNISDGRLKYLMNKTSKNRVPKWKNIKLSVQALNILKLYDIHTKGNDEYIFPILDTTKDLDDPRIFDLKKQSKTALSNKYLKKIAKLAEIKENLSTHIARHSFANYALKKNKPLYAISKALAHTDLKTTQVYLNAFDEVLLDKEMDKLF